VLAGTVDVQRRGVVEELVADGALHGPVAQGLAGMQDLLHPDVLGAGVAQAPQVARGIGQAVGVVDPQPSTSPSSRSSSTLPWENAKTSSRSIRSATRSSMSKNRRAKPGLRVDVEHLGPPLLVGPPAVLVRRAHVVGDDVEDDPEARTGERAERLLAAELGRDAGRVDDVVAVRGARPRLQRRGEVQVRDAEVAEVRDQLGGRPEVQVGRELQAVGGAQLGHADAASSPSTASTRRRTTTERAGIVTVPRGGTRHASASFSGSEVDSSSDHSIP
jgi:hypothetical protein